MATTKINYRFARDDNGDWCIAGPFDQMIEAARTGAWVEVTKKSGAVSQVKLVGTVTPTDRPGEGMAVFENIKRHPISASKWNEIQESVRRGDATVRRVYGARRGQKACITDGNCSSFGDGHSCGGYDCDGF